MRRLLLSLAALLGVVLVAVFVSAFWLLHTEAGARFIYERGVAASGGRLSAGSVAGSVSGGLQLQDVAYADAAADVRIASLSAALDPDVLWPALAVVSLRADGVVVTLGAAESAPAATTVQAIEDVLASLRLPLPVSVQDLELRNVRVVAASGEELFAAERLLLSGSLHDSLQIERLALDTLPAAGELSGTLQLAPPYTLQLAANVERADGWPVAGTRVTLRGPLDELALQLQGRELPVSLSALLRDLTAAPAVEGSLSAPRIALPLDAAEPAVVLEDIELQMNGSPQEWRAQLSARVLTATLEPFRAEAIVAGDTAAATVERFAAESGQFAATGAGSLAWAGGFEAEASVDIDRFDPAGLVARWPAGELLAGRVAARFAPGRALELAELHLSQLQRDTVLTANGLIDLDVGTVDLAVTGEALQWPLAPATARVESPRADLRVTGALADWRAEGTLALTAPDLPAGTFRVTASGTPQAVAVDIHDSELLGGSVTGQARLELHDAMPFTAELQTRDIRTAPLVPDYPGRVSMTISVAGRLAPLAADLRIARLDGELRGRPVAARGRIRFADGLPSFEDFVLRSGESRLALDGSLDGARTEGEGLAFEAQVESLGDFLPETAGALTASGRLYELEPVPRLDLVLDAERLAVQGVLVESVALRNAPGNTADSAPFDLDLTATGVNVGGRNAESLHVRLQGAPDHHELTAEVVSEGTQLSLAAHGGANLAGGPRAGWRGTLESLQAVRGEVVVASLREPVALHLGGTTGGIDRSCFDIGPGGALCAGGSYAPGGQFAVSGALEDVPLDLLRLLNGTELGFSQQLNGRFDLGTGPAGRMSGSGRIDITPGEIRNPYDERLTVRTRGGFVAFRLADGQLLSGEISLPFSTAAEISGEFNMLDLGQGADSAVEGRLHVDVRDLGVGARILPQIDAARGSLLADLAVSGTLALPVFSGEARIRDGGIEYSPLGFELHDVQLDSRIEPGNRLQLEGSFAAGEGKGRLRSSADYLSGETAGFEVAIDGESLTLVQLDDLAVTINPALEVGLRGNRLAINGRVVVPAARLASVKFINTGVSESDDVVIVGGELPDEEVEKSSRLEYAGAVELTLGDNVVIDLDVAEARLAGSATYRWNGPPLPVATGGFDIRGKFEAYGQLLEISEGVIRYPDVPASNPELRIRAEREIYGNSEIRRAGVLVSGTAQRPAFEVYTVPATTQNRALTLLATGSDFNYEQGVGAVDVGTYIAPRLYASYGIGLFDRENVISVRYDLARGFGIKATSGRRAAGIDISYTIER